VVLTSAGLSIVPKVTRTTTKPTRVSGCTTTRSRIPLVLRREGDRAWFQAQLSTEAAAVA
jgi:hypothetical protein